MTSYSTVEGLWLTRLQAMSQFTANNSSRGRWGIRNSGASNQYCIIKPGSHTRQMVSYTLRQDNFQTIIQLWQRYKDDGDTMTDLESLVDAVLVEIDKYPHLGDSTRVVDCNISEVREMQEILDSPGGGPVWLMVELVGEVNEQTEITFSE